MCSENQILSNVKLAKELEKTNPSESARNYLLAAKGLLQESKGSERENEYIELANKMYLRAKELKSNNQAEPDFKQAEVKSKSDNKVTFSDIGGLENLKDEIRFKIIEPFKHPEIYEFYGKQMGGGILMYGPPGCGKSLIAEATANEAEANFFHVKSSDLKSKFVGETEQNIAELFEKVREKQPAIIFFDEFESLGGDRAESQAYDRSAVSQFLTEMDGVDSKNQQILLLAATNEPWSIDPALRREGRFGKTIFVPPPDKEARKEILKLVLGTRPVGKLDYSRLADLTGGFSGADIKALCESATDIPLKESLRTGIKRNISMEDIESSIISSQSVVKQWFDKAKKQVNSKKLQDSFSEIA